MALKKDYFIFFFILIFLFGIWLNIYMFNHCICCWFLFYFFDFIIAFMVYCCYSLSRHWDSLLCEIKLYYIYILLFPSFYKIAFLSFYKMIEKVNFIKLKVLIPTYCKFLFLCFIVYYFICIYKVLAYMCVYISFFVLISKSFFVILIVYLYIRS